jgi:hypothetical protein
MSNENVAIYIGCGLNIPRKLFHIPTIHTYIMVDHQRDTIFQQQLIHKMNELGFIHIPCTPANPFIFANQHLCKMIIYFYATVYPDRPIFPWIPNYNIEDHDISNVLPYISLTNKVIIGEHLPDKILIDHLNISDFGKIELYYLNHRLYDKYKRHFIEHGDNFSLIGGICEKRIPHINYYLK